MALLNVTAYFNTGFSKGNIPSSPSVLENATKKVYPPVWKLQSQGLAKVRIKAPWEEISQIDYVKLGTAYYTVSGIVMTNGNVAELQLDFDPINSIGGVNNFNILDGWVTRVSPISDELFQNVYPEPWSPRRELYMNVPQDMTSGGGSGDDMSFIGCTVDILDNKLLADTYRTMATADAQLGEPVVYVPSVKPISTETECTIEAEGPFANAKGQFLPWSMLYNMVSEGVQAGIARLRSLGLETTITCAYRAPAYYITPTSSGSKITKVTGKVHEYTSYYKYIYGQYVPKNKKAYCLYNTYHVVNFATGNTMAYEARELYNDDEAPAFWIYADPSPDGRPYCQPKYYEKAPTKAFQNAVAGGRWLTNGQRFLDSSGSLIRANEYGQQRRDLYRQFGRYGNLGTDGTWGDLADMGKALASAAAAFAGGGGNDLINPMFKGMSTYAPSLSNDVNFRNMLARTSFEYKSQEALAAPEVIFPYTPEVQGYIGNGFMIYRTCLQEADMIALDNFLTMYGYSNSRRLTQEDLTSHQHFNFVQADNVALTGNIAMWLRNAISDYFKGGVRLWHEMPNRPAMLDNPIKASVLAKGVKEADVV